MLTDEQRQAYEQDGYLVVEDLLSHEEADAFLAEQEKEKEEVRGLGLKRYLADTSWSSLAKHGKICAIVSELMAGDPMIVQTMYMAKSPEGGTGVALHQDTHYIRS